MIVGTAGHVDHGKTALVKALTGVDTDRLAEEKRRGITIDLGFAPLRLPGDIRFGVVDVPGHEAFVRNMLAGATGVDLALLVVAADEGVMPQTREHLAILTLLGIKGGVVAITKTDLVDEEWLDLVRDDLRAALHDTPLADAPLVPTSVVSGVGLDDLRDALSEAARSLPARDAEDLFRMPVDRAFSVRGTGTVATGTVWSGCVARDALVRLLPGDRSARVRGIETHGEAVLAAAPGTRAAIALAGIDVHDVGRGSILVADGAWAPSRTLLADVALLEGVASRLGPRTRVRFHLGTSDVGARVVASGGALTPGEARHVRVVLDEPVVARAGDRFVLRGIAPVVTIGGGIVADPQPPHRRPRPRAARTGTPAERLECLLVEGGVHGVEVASLAVRAGVPPRDVPGLLAAVAGRARQLAARLYSESVVEAVALRLSAVVDEFHLRNPLEPGVPLQSARSQLGAPPELVEEALRRQVNAGRLEIAGSLARRAGWRPELTSAQDRVRGELLGAIERAGREPPSVGELEAAYGSQAASLLRLLERAELIVHVESDRYYARTVVEAMTAELRARMTPGREYAPPELREILGFSRKYLIPFLEYCDRARITERRPTGRVLIPS